MSPRKSISVLTIASLIYWAPSVVPLVPHQTASAFTCGLVWLPVDTAFAEPAPCPVPTPKAATPWPVIGLIAGVVTIMLDAAIVWNTQCRELTLEEAMTAGALPGVGLAVNLAKAPTSACPGTR